MYVGDTWVVQREENKQNFLQHINSVDPAITFTGEDNKEDGSIPFLDIHCQPEADGKLSITVYRKPTHTDQYLQWDSYHHLSAEYSVINTLTHRVKTVCNRPELHQKAMEHLRKVLTHFKYPKWALDKVEKRLTKPSSEVSNKADSQCTADVQPCTNEVNTKGYVVISYTQGLCKSIREICSRFGIQTHFKGNSIINSLVVSPKDKDPMANKSGAIYWFQCGDLTCDDEYIGETSRTFGERFKEHLKEPSPIHHHSINTGHPTT